MSGHSRPANDQSHAGGCVEAGLPSSRGDGAQAHAPLERNAGSSQLTAHSQATGQALQAINEPAGGCASPSELAVADGLRTLRAIEDNARFMDAACRELIPLLELFAAVVTAQQAGKITAAQIEHAASRVEEAALAGYRRELPVAIAQVRERARHLERILAALDEPA